MLFGYRSTCFFCQQNFSTHTFFPITSSPITFSTTNKNLNSLGFSKVCKDCFNELPKNNQSCQKCAEPLPFQNNIRNSYHSKTTATDLTQHLCESCKLKTPPWDHIVSAFSYRYPIKEAIHQFKFNRIFSYGEVMVEILIGQLKAYYAHQPMPHIIVPIPSHKKRIYERKFNANLWLANKISNRLNIRLADKNIRKIRHTAAQNTLDYEQRQTNLIKSFESNNGKFFRNQHVAIFDDVMTTGATMRQMADIISANQPASIHIWTIARTPKKISGTETY